MCNIRFVQVRITTTECWILITQLCALMRSHEFLCGLANWSSALTSLYPAGFVNTIPFADVMGLRDFCVGVIFACEILTDGRIPK